MPGVTEHLARALIDVHGQDAEAFARQALHNVQRLDMMARAKEWEAVIVVIKAMRKAATEAAPDKPSSGAR